MSMPKIKCKKIDGVCAATSILQSIALQEAGLAHIINAEGEKLQKAIAMCDTDMCDLLEINESVESMIEKVTALEIVLKSKVDAVVPIINEKKTNCKPQYKQQSKQQHNHKCNPNCK